MRVYINVIQTVQRQSFPSVHGWLSLDDGHNVAKFGWALADVIQNQHTVGIFGKTTSVPTTY